MMTLDLTKEEIERIRRGQKAIIRKVRPKCSRMIIDGKLYEIAVERWTPAYAFRRRKTAFLSRKNFKEYCKEIGVREDEVCYVIFLVKKLGEVNFPWL